MVGIFGKKIGEGEPVFVVAELSANHLQDLDLALKTIEAIKESGADAVKLQTYTVRSPLKHLAVCIRLRRLAVLIRRVLFPHNLGAFGDAGAVVTNYDELAESTRRLGVRGGQDKYNVEHIGYKARIYTLQAGVLLAKLKYIDHFAQKRREIAKIHMGNLKDLDNIKIPYTPSEDYYHTFHQLIYCLNKAW